MGRESLRALSFGAIAVALPASGARLTGIDVSEYQGTINWTQVKGSGKTFAFIRATRGGTSGNSDFDNDATYATNIVNAKAAGLLVSAYHFARPDVLLNGSVTQDAANEAQHFMSVAGASMTPGYLRPVLDVEAGNGLSTAQLSLWVNTFCNTITASKGAAADPIVYVNTDYAYNELDTSVNTHALWLARYNNGNSASTNAQVEDPEKPNGYNNQYGVWNKPDPKGPPQDPGPWAFWQYTSLGACPGINPAVNTVDLDVFNSDIANINTYVIPEPSLAPLALIACAAAARRRRRPA